MRAHDYHGAEGSNVNDLLLINLETVVKTESTCNTK